MKQWPGAYLGVYRISNEPVTPMLLVVVKKIGDVGVKAPLGFRFQPRNKAVVVECLVLYFFIEIW
jgi:hypothetical protein